MNSRYIHKTFLMAILLSLLVVVSGANAQTSFLRNSPEVLAAFKTVIKNPSASTVLIKCNDKEVSLGTIVGADGWILTKASQLQGDPICHLKDERKFPAKVVGVHEKYDLAMLKVDAKDLPVIEWYESKKAPVGSIVASPGLGDIPVEIGVISVASRNIRFWGRAPRSQAYLGIQFDPNESEKVKIVAVMPDTAADKAKLKKDDIIRFIDDKKITTPESLLAALGKYKPKDVIKVKIERGDEELTIKVTLGKRPGSLNRGAIQNRMGSKLSDVRSGFPYVLQHDSVIEPTECGGPLVDLNGKMIGINIARAGRTESYAIPTEKIKPLLADLKSGKLAPNGDEKEKEKEKEKD